MNNLIQNMRYGLRILRKKPVSSIVAVLTLAIGIAAITVIFSALNPILFQPLPYSHSERITIIQELGSDGLPKYTTYGMGHELALRNNSFESIAIFKPWQPILTGKGQPERLDGQCVSASYFQVIGKPPAMGRDFKLSEDVMNGPNIVILSYKIWQQKFNGDPAIIGSPITLDGVSYSVIGVMPNSFENVLSPTADLWTLLQYGMTEGRTWGHHLHAVGRLKPNFSIGMATQELNAIGNAVLKEMRPEGEESSIKIIGINLQSYIAREVKPALLAILSAVILVLMIACVNVTNLLLARGFQRRSEFALRAALGARPWEIIQQVLIESVILALVGGGVGIILAGLGMDALVAFSPAELPRKGAIKIDTTVMFFALGITMLTGLCSGLTPALQAVRGNIQQHLKHGWRHTNGSSRRVSNVLVIMELAIAIVLLVISGLLLRSLWRLFDVTPGFNPSRVITMQVQTIGPGYSYKDEPIHVLQEQMLDAVKKVPGVKTAALTSHLPMSNDFLEKYPIFPESSHVRRQEEDDQVALRYAVTSDYFKAMGIELRSGRLLDEHDRGDTARVVLINESFAKRLFRDINPIGQRLHIGSVDRPIYTIVGVVGDVRHISLVSNETNAVYTTPRQWLQSERVMSLVVRAKIDDPVTLLPAIRDSIHSVDKDQPLARTITMDVLLANSAAERRFVFIIFEVFAIVALLLASAGIYGILAGNVAERTLEIGVRMALGASRGNILALVGYHGMILTGIGAIIGVVGAIVASSAVTSMLFNVSPLDPITYISVVAVLIGVSLIACAVPAWRAVRVDPTITLRKE